MLHYFDMVLDVAKKVHDYGQHADFIKDCKALDSTLDRGNQSLLFKCLPSLSYV
jgi:hypothetical protein